MRRICDNGLVLLAERVSGTESIGIGLGMRLGSRHESDAESGVTHACEHLVIRALNRYLGAMVPGRYKLQGFTEREETYFSLRGLVQDLDELLDRVLLFLHTFTPEEKEFEAERPVILEEVLADEQSEISCIDRAFFEAAYGGGALGRAIMGTRCSVDNLEFGCVVEHLQKMVMASSVIAVVGDFDCEGVLDRCEKELGTLSRYDPGYVDGNAKFVPGVTPVPNRLDATYFRYAFPLFERADPRRIAVYALNYHLGDDMSSRLFRRIREELGLVYSIKTEFSLFSDTGFFEVRGLTSSKSLSCLIKEIDKTVMNSVGALAGGLGLQAIKDGLKLNLLLNLDEPNNRMIRLLKHEVWFREYYFISDDLELIDSLTLDDMEQACQSIFTEKSHLCYGVQDGEHIAS
jgi:predicted Zn-dependent peptidase